MIHPSCCLVSQSNWQSVHLFLFSVLFPWYHQSYSFLYSQWIDRVTKDYMDRTKNTIIRCYHSWHWIWGSNITPLIVETVSSRSLSTEHIQTHFDVGVLRSNIIRCLRNVNVRDFTDYEPLQFSDFTVYLVLLLKTLPYFDPISKH